MHELKAGQAVQFRVNGFPEREFAGRVRRIDATANATTRQVEVVVDFVDPAGAPRVAGLFAEGRVQTGTAQTLAVPETALQRNGEQAHVWRVDGQALRKVAVTLGERDPRSGDWPVLSGLAAGDRILRNPGSTLVDGQPLEFATPAAGAGSAAVAGATR
jgi:multidrug efflux pump subunit AcrA (membrane-fusion protein)